MCQLNVNMIQTKVHKISLLPSQIQCTQLTDDFSGLGTDLCSIPTTTLLSFPLTECTCIILPPSHLTPSPQHPSPLYVQLFELLSQAEFVVTGVQMTRLSQHTADALQTASGADSKVYTCTCTVVYTCTCTLYMRLDLQKLNILHSIFCIPL